MGLKIRKSASSNGGASKFVKTTVLRDYPLIVVHVARTGERTGYKGKGMQDYMVGDFLGFDKDGKLVYQEFGALWGINRRETGEPGAIFNALGDHGVYVGKISKIETKSGNDANVWYDTDPGTVPEQVEQALALLEEKGTPEGASAPAQESSAQVQPTLQKPW